MPSKYPTRPEVQVQIARYLRNTATSACALAKAVCPEYNQAVYRILNGDGVRPEIYDSLLDYMAKNPEGPPKTKFHNKTGGRRIPRAKFNPGGSSPSFSSVREQGPEPKRAIPIMAPSIGEFDSKEQEWVKKEAFRRGLPLSSFLAELVQLGITTYIEDQKEEEASKDGKGRS